MLDCMYFHVTVISRYIASLAERLHVFKEYYGTFQNPTENMSHVNYYDKQCKLYDTLIYM